MMRAVLALMMALSIAALAYATVALVGPVPPEEGTPAEGGAASTASNAEAPSTFKPPSLASLDAIFARPLFRPGRRPAAAEPDPEPEPEPEVEPEEADPAEEEPETEPPLTLRGVVLAGGGGFALAEHDDGGPAIRISAGESVDGWRLVSLAVSAATFEKAGRTVILRLETAGAASEEGEDDADADDD